MTAEPAHVVGAVQHWLDRLNLAVPIALCGESLGTNDPIEIGALPTGPVCRDCAQRAGWGRDRIAAYDASH